MTTLCNVQTLKQNKPLLRPQTHWTVKHPWKLIHLKPLSDWEDVPYAMSMNKHIEDILRIAILHSTHSLEKTSKIWFTESRNGKYLQLFLPTLRELGFHGNIPPQHLKSRCNIPSYIDQAWPHIMSVLVSVVTSTASLHGNSDTDNQLIKWNTG